MERLRDFVASVTRSLSEEHDAAVGEEFCDLAVGIDSLRGAMKEGEAKEAAKEEKAEEADFIAIAWRVEYDLTRYIE